MNFYHTESISRFDKYDIYDGKDIWMISSLMGKKKLSDEESKNYQSEMNWWDVISEKAEIVGTEKSNFKRF